MLAKSLSGEEGDKPLRDLINLGENEINAAVDSFSKDLRRQLSQARDTLRQRFDIADKKASAVAKGSADGVSIVTKFKTYKMSTGKVEDYYLGLNSRIGTFPDLLKHGSLSLVAVAEMSGFTFVENQHNDSLPQERQISISPWAFGKSTMKCGDTMFILPPETTG
jgi:hypothetical protein